jgi:predicted ATPase
LLLPATAADVESAEASALFVQEARRVALDYELTAQDRLPLVRLCQLLGGFPLALVLAARWTPLLACAAVAQEIQSGIGLDMLTTSDADLPERHRSITCILERALAELQCSGRTPAQLLTVASRTLDEHGLLNADTGSGTFELHPLLRAYLRTASVAGRVPELVA